MAISLKGRSFVTLKDFTSREIHYLLELSQELRRKKLQGLRAPLLEGKNVVLIFDKPSTRTRTAFEVGALDEGAGVTFLTDSHMGKKESVEDTAKVLGRMYDGIEYRGFKQTTVDTLAKYAGVPVWNGLTDVFHPTQILADFLTLMDHYRRPLRGMRFVFVGDARNNMGNSYMIGCAKMGMHFVGIAPKILWPEKSLWDEMSAFAKETGGTIEYTESIDEGVKGANSIATDVWVSMGEPDDVWATRIKQLKPYRVTMDMLKKSGNPNVVFLHCLPSFHNRKTIVGEQMYEKFGLDCMEVTDEVFKSRHSLVFDEAENRLHTIKAIMVATIGNL